MWAAKLEKKKNGKMPKKAAFNRVWLNLDSVKAVWEECFIRVCNCHQTKFKDVHPYNHLTVSAA